MRHQYQIIITSHKRKLEFVGSYPTREIAMRAFHQLKLESEKVVFPVKYINKETIERADYEIVLIKRRNYDESTVSQIRDEYGGFKDITTDNQHWIVFDKAPYYKEERFWVYGYHPLRDRKDINFIFDNLVKPKAINKYEFVNIEIYNNKILFETYSNTDMVICKNKSDCIRLYNTLQEMCVKDKQVKYFLFSGNGGGTKIRARKMIDKIKKLTNWNDTKIKRTKTSER